MKRSIAARMRWIAPQAAIRPWMIAITAPAAGTIMLTRRSTRMAMSAAGIADLMASQAILPTWAIVIPPLVSRFQTDLPRPSRDSTLSLNHCEMACLSAAHRWFLMPSMIAAPRFRIQAPGLAATSLMITANWASVAIIAFAFSIAALTAFLTALIAALMPFLSRSRPALSALPTAFMTRLMPSLTAVTIRFSAATACLTRATIQFLNLVRSALKPGISLSPSAISLLATALILSATNLTARSMTECAISFALLIALVIAERTLLKMLVMPSLTLS